VEQLEQLEFTSIIEQVKRPERTPEEIEASRLLKIKRVKDRRMFERSLVGVPASTPKNPSERERVKYIYISEMFKSKRTFYKKGKSFSNKEYGIGILTEDNYYYFSELHVSENFLTKTLLEKLHSFFTSKLLFTTNTRMCISKSIYRSNEPIVIFFRMISSTIGIRVKGQTYTNMLKQINEFYGCVKCPYGSYTSQKNKRMMQKMLDEEMFPFIPDPEWYEKRELKKKKQQKSITECAVAMIYMDAASQRKEIFDRYLERVKNNVPTRKMISKEERKKMEKEERLRRKEELKRNGNKPERYTVNDDVLGKIEVVNLLWWR